MSEGSSPVGSMAEASPPTREPLQNPAAEMFGSAPRIAGAAPATVSPGLRVPSSRELLVASSLTQLRHARPATPSKPPAVMVSQPGPPSSPAMRPSAGGRMPFHKHCGGQEAPSAGPPGTSPGQSRGECDSAKQRRRSRVRKSTKELAADELQRVREINRLSAQRHRATQRKIREQINARLKSLDHRNLQLRSDLSTLQNEVSSSRPVFYEPADREMNGRTG